MPTLMLLSVDKTDEVRRIFSVSLTAKNKGLLLITSIYPAPEECAPNTTPEVATLFLAIK